MLSSDHLRLDNVLPANIFEKAVFTLSGTDGTYGNPKPFKVISISENQDKKIRKKI